MARGGRCASARTRTGALGLLCASLALVCPPGARAQQVEQSFGMNAKFDEIVTGGDHIAQVGPALPRELAAIGVTHYRRDALWLTEKGARWQGDSWTFRRGLEHGLRWSPVLVQSPEWASGMHDQPHAPPRDPNDYAQFAREVAERYGRNGSFFREPENAGYPVLPVTRYEIWNEPNLGTFWPPAPNAAEYAALYAAARPAIKGIDPAATVIVGGLAPPTAAAFLQSMYAANPGLKGNVDGVGLHTYGPDAASVLRQVASVRRVLDALGEHVPIHITEIGWPTRATADTLGGFALPEPARAAALGLATDALMASDCNVASVEPYLWHAPGDQTLIQTATIPAEAYMGMYFPAGEGHTPTSRAFTSSIRRHRPVQHNVPVCGERAAAAQPFVLKIAAERTGASRSCAEAVVLYRGNPLSGATVTAKLVRDGRRAPVSKRAKTASDGTARICLTAPRASRREMRVRASVLNAAQSRELRIR